MEGSSSKSSFGLDISARLIANQVSYKFKGDIISAIAAGLKGQVKDL